MKINRNKKLKKTKISFVKLFYTFYKKHKKAVKKYGKMWGLQHNIFYFDICLNKKNKKLFKKIDIYNYLNEIFENFDGHYIIHVLRKNVWFASYYNEAQIDFTGQLIGNRGMQISKISKRDKIKTLKILYYEYDEYDEYN